jgi:hypothetical protein
MLCCFACATGNLKKDIPSESLTMAVYDAVSNLVIYEGKRRIFIF